MVAFASLVLASSFAGVPAPLAVAALPVAVCPAPQARPPVPPRPPRPPRPPQARSGFDSLRRKIADRTPGQGAGRDRLRDRRFWGQTPDQDKDRGGKEAEKPTDLPIDPADLEAMTEALDKTVKRLDEMKRRSRARLDRFDDPESVHARMERFKLDHYDRIAKLVGSARKSVSKDGSMPASLVGLMAPERDTSGREKPERGSFEDLRSRFLAAEAKSFATSSRSSRNPSVKALYEKLRFHVETRRQEVEKLGVKPGGDPAKKPTDARPKGPSDRRPGTPPKKAAGGG